MGWDGIGWDRIGSGWVGSPIRVIDPHAVLAPECETRVRWQPAALDTVETLAEREQRRSCTGGVVVELVTLELHPRM